MPFRATPRSRPLCRIPWARWMSIGWSARGFDSNNARGYQPAIPQTA
jgi:hypothetical protein